MAESDNTTPVNRGRTPMAEMPHASKFYAGVRAALVELHDLDEIPEAVAACKLLREALTTKFAWHARRLVKQALEEIKDL